jgi:hypothetical protein
MHVKPWKKNRLPGPKERGCNRRALSMIANITGSIVIIRRELDKIIPNFTRNFTASSIEIHFVEELRSVDLIWNLWFLFWTSFSLMDLIIAIFKIYHWKSLLNMGASCTIQKTYGWIVEQSKIFVICGQEIDVLKWEKQISCWTERWKVALGFPIDVWYQHHLYDSIKLQGQQQFISDRVGIITTFDMKMKLFREEVILICVISLLFLWFAS